MPKRICGYDSHFTFFGSISLALIISRDAVIFITFSQFIVLFLPAKNKNHRQDTLSLVCGICWGENRANILF